VKRHQKASDKIRDSAWHMDIPSFSRTQVIENGEK
jgi:hypothetical protein